MRLSVFDDRTGLAVKPHHTHPAVLAREIVEHGAHQVGHDLRQLVTVQKSKQKSKGQVSHLAKSSKPELVFGNGKTLRMNTPLLFTMSPQVMTCANLSRVLRRSVG